MRGSYHEVCIGDKFHKLINDENELTGEHLRRPAVPFSMMTNFLTPRDGCYCGSRHKHGQLGLANGACARK